jgi:hypothetical protein
MLIDEHMCEKRSQKNTHMENIVNSLSVIIGGHATQHFISVHLLLEGHFNKRIKTPTKLAFHSLNHPFRPLPQPKFSEDLSFNSKIFLPFCKILEDHCWVLVPEDYPPNTIQKLGSVLWQTKRLHSRRWSYQCRCWVLRAHHAETTMPNSHLNLIVLFLSHLPKLATNG